MSDILTHKTKNNRKRSFGGVTGGRVYERSPRRLWTKQSGEINYLVADTGTAARGRSYCPAETEKNNSPEAKQRITSAKSKSPSLFRDVTCLLILLTPPPQATYWSHQPWPYSSGGFHLQVVQSCQHSLLPSAPPPHMKTHLLSVPRTLLPLTETQPRPFFSGKIFLSMLLEPCSWARNTSSLTHKHQQIFLFISCHVDFRKHFASHFTRHLRKLLHASWAVRWTCLW